MFDMVPEEQMLCRNMVTPSSHPQVYAYLSPYEYCSEISEWCFEPDDSTKKRDLGGHLMTLYNNHQRTVEKGMEQVTGASVT